MDPPAHAVLTIPSRGIYIPLLSHDLSLSLPPCHPPLSRRQPWRCPVCGHVRSGSFDLCPGYFLSLTYKKNLNQTRKCSCPPFLYCAPSDTICVNLWVLDYDLHGVEGSKGPRQECPLSLSLMTEKFCACAAKDCCHSSQEHLICPWRMKSHTLHLFNNDLF